MTDFHLNPDLFFFLKDNELILWDYQNHQQFSLNSSYFDRLLAHARKEAKVGQGETDAIDQHLLSEGILLNKPVREPIWNWDKLSYIFHTGTCNTVDDTHASVQDWLATYISDCEQAVESMPQERFIHREGPLVSLPSPDLATLNRLPFSTILKDRQTIRNFNGQPVSLEALSTLLFVTFGLFHGPWQELSDAGLREVGLRKTSASGGGLHPNEAYVTIHHVPGIDPGVYHYDVERHGLVRVSEAASDDQISALCMGQPFGRGMAFGVFLVAYMDKMWWKYPHSRGYRVVLIDAGHLSQTFQLVAASLGVLTWMTANIHDGNVAKLLTLDGPHQAPLHFLGAGYGHKSGVYAGVLEHFKRD